MIKISNFYLINSEPLETERKEQSFTDEMSDIEFDSDYVQPNPNKYHDLNATSSQ